MVSLSLPHKNAPPELKSTYYGIYALTILVVAVILVNIFGNYSLKRDHDLEEQIQSQQTSVETYISSHSKLPDIISDVGVTESKGVEYKKINSLRYMLCATFKTKSDGFSSVVPYGDTQLMNGANLELKANTKFTNGDSGILKHDKGYTCFYYDVSGMVNDYQSITPPAKKTDDYVYTKCSTYSNSYMAVRTAKIQSVDTVNHSIVLDPSYTQNYLDSSGYVSNPVKIDTMKYPAFAEFYNSTCTKIKDTDLTAGQFVNFYVSAQQDSQSDWIEVLPSAAGIEPGGICSTRNLPCQNL